MEAPDNYYQQAGFCSQFPTEKHHSLDSNKSAADHFVVEDLLDFSNEDDAVVSDGIINNGSSSFDAVGNNSTDSSTVTVVDSCNSSSGGDIGCHNFPPESHFGSELCVPYDDLAELEWLSNFVEESFSSEDLQKMQLISGMKATRPDESSEIGNFQPDQNGDDNCHNINSAIAGDGNNNNNPIFHPEMLVPAKARSKRSRNAPCNWASRLLMLSPTTSSSEPEIVVGGSGPHPLPHPTSGKKTVKAIVAVHKKKDGGGVEGVAAAGNNVEDGRRCLHCATDKTPQWRTGPMGPKTLCNACGVRYKSGRLVPEYRPAASPTFVLSKHSNSHRKVLELRRQKEMMRGHEQHHPQQFLHHHHQNMVFDVSNSDDYLIHQHVGPDFRQLI